jgi:DNA polymerase (family 10)
MENREIATLLAETADLMEIAAEDPFRIRSYRNAASAVESFPERLAAICDDPSRKLTDIPGIGKGIAAVIAEILHRGSFDRRDQLIAKYPPTALEFLKIQGLGPKSIALIWEHFRVSSIDELERLCREQKLRTLPRMGSKLEEKVLRSIEQYRTSAGRFLLPHAQKLAGEISQYLRDTSGVERVTAAGSLRRGRETVGDIDLLVTGPDPTPALDRFIAHPAVSQVLGQGANKEGQRGSRTTKDPDRCAGATAGVLWCSYAVLHRQQGAQRRVTTAGTGAGSHVERVRALPAGGQRASGG